MSETHATPTHRDTYMNTNTHTHSNTRGVNAKEAARHHARVEQSRQAALCKPQLPRAEVDLEHGHCVVAPHDQVRHCNVRSVAVRVHGAPHGPVSSGILRSHPDCTVAQQTRRCTAISTVLLGGNYVVVSLQIRELPIVAFTKVCSSLGNRGCPSPI